MTTVVREGNVKISVYAEGAAPHHAPHCHVYWPGGSASILFNGDVVRTKLSLPDEARRLYLANKRKLHQIWNQLNPPATNA